MKTVVLVVQLLIKIYIYKTMLYNFFIYRKTPTISPGIILVPKKFLMD